MYFDLKEGVASLFAMTFRRGIMIEIRQDKDLVTLVTCTPYSVNTHRLLVRGHRIELTEEEITEETKATEPEASTWMEKYIEGIFFGFIIGGAVLVLVRALSKKVRENQ